MTELTGVPSLLSRYGTPVFLRRGLFQDQPEPMLKRRSPGRIAPGLPSVR